MIGHLRASTWVAATWFAATWFTAWPAVGSASDNPATAGVTFERLAQEADLVALAQSRDTDYFYRRDFPVSGSAYLKSLIAYKVDRPIDIIEVFEQGLHANECYFPATTVFEEGRRFLLFLQADPEDEVRYRGLKWGCALEVLVDSSNRYALRYPLAGISIEPALSDLVRPMTFADSNALVSEEDLSPAQRDEWLAGGWIVPRDGRFIFTHGIAVSAIRKLMGEDNMTADRHLTRRPSSDNH